MQTCKRKGRLLRNKLSKVTLKLETSNVKTGKKKSVSFFLVNTEYKINCQL